MYLKKFKLINFRKFGSENNEIELINSHVSKNSENQNEINIASSSTLIVGKNNAGKTTVVEGLDKLVHSKQFVADDFNYRYLKTLLEEYLAKNYTNIPSLEFTLTIGLDENKEDYIVNIAPFMSISSDEKEIEIIIRYEIEETELFLTEIKSKIKKEQDTKELDENQKLKLFYKLVSIINSTKFKLNYYNSDKKRIDKFNLKELIDFYKIEANNLREEYVLSKSFNRIINSRYKLGEEYDSEGIDRSIEKINDELTGKLNSDHTENVNSTIDKIIDEDLKVKLTSDLTFEKIFSNLVKYNYVENDNYVPENQFGLGYTNLMVIISRLIEYMEKYPNDSFNSKINIIGIEEPETYMHPQLQELFISNINDAINTLLKASNKNVNTQLIISTHSSHIVNSKIHTGGSFDCINYMCNEKSNSKVVPLKDKIIAPDGKTEEKDFKFIKKHITFKFSDIFFCDAVILVEGICENTLMPYFLSRENKLNKKYISIIQVNGAHGKVYTNLIKLLGIPCVIMTDIDILRTGADGISQIESLKDKKTTNETLKMFWGKDELNDGMSLTKDSNIFVSTQCEAINGFFATSFEEAIILENYDNVQLNNALKNTHKTIYNSITENSNKKENNKYRSYEWQTKLSGSKTSFANNLLYELLTSDAETLSTPKYILDGFKFLHTELIAGE
jgi:predicted ATP-dependent endonuclease of OLD family